MAKTAPAELTELASRYGIQPSYLDVANRRQDASPETLLSVLKLLGAPLERMEDAAEALQSHRRQSWHTIAPPVSVAWDGKAAIPLRVPEPQLTSAYQCRLDLEQGEPLRQEGRVAELPTRRGRDVEGVHHVIKRLRLAQRLPLGYHRMTLEVAGQTLETTIISAPQRAYVGHRQVQPRRWGVFLPLYALHRQSSWGGGDFSDLEALMSWVASRGGNLVATLPMLDSPSAENISPYAPTSRLFWNDFYVDVGRIPELARSEAARRLIAEPDFQQEVQSLRREPMVDYRRQMSLKRRVLEILADDFFRQPSERQAELEQYLGENPEAETYARFRAAADKQPGPWPTWPEPLRSGRIAPADYDEPAYRRHLYAQWQAAQQFQAASRRARELKLSWYLDYPLGVSGDGYDAWRHQALFVRGASGGAPPDAFFTRGQDWGFPPLDPEAIRRDRYGYVIAALRQHLRYAGALRMDHVMSFYRLYWVPQGMAAKDGVYVHYPMDELFGVLTLESHRHQAEMVGENLGTVPPEVDAALTLHGVDGLYVVQYELKPGAAGTLRPIPAGSVAGLNTHDMPTFATFWSGLDIDDRMDLGLLDAAAASRQRDTRADMRAALIRLLESQQFVEDGVTNTESVLEACLSLLARSPAAVVLVGLEDLWAETQPQNTPGTLDQRPNWQRKTKLSFEEFIEFPAVRRILDRVARERSAIGSHPPAAGDQQTTPGSSS
jgi:4-alpha-glucanotransferase